MTWPSAGQPPPVSDAVLNRAAEERVLNVDELKTPVKIQSMELLRTGHNFIVRVRSTDGAEGLSVPNAMRLLHVYPFFVSCVAPFFSA